MAQLSINNGATYIDATERDELQAAIGTMWNTIVVMMEDDIRESVHRAFDGETNLDFLIDYLNAADAELIIG